VASVSLLTTLMELPVRLIGSGFLSAVITVSTGCSGGEPGLLAAAGAVLAVPVSLRICLGD
jgi:hypothetical protein